MEDYIVREIDRIGVLLRGLLARLGAGCGGKEERAAECRRELRAELGLELDALLAEEDFIGVLRGRCGFGEEHLEPFAELLFGLFRASEDAAERRRLAGCAATLCRRLDAAGFPPSWNRLLILRELEEQAPL